MSDDDASSPASDSLSASSSRTVETSTTGHRSLTLLGICARCRLVIWLNSQSHMGGGRETETHYCDPLASPYVQERQSQCEETLAVHNQNLAYLIQETNHYLITTYAMRPHLLQSLPTSAPLYWAGDIPPVLLPFVESPPEDESKPVVSPFISICPSCDNTVWYSSRGDVNHHWGRYMNESFEAKLWAIAQTTPGFLSLQIVQLLEKENLGLRNMQGTAAVLNDNDNDDDDDNNNDDSNNTQWGADESAAPLCAHRQLGHASRRNRHENDEDNCEGRRKRQAIELHGFLLAKFGTSPHTKLNIPADVGLDLDADTPPIVPVSAIYDLTPYETSFGWPFSPEPDRRDMQYFQNCLMAFFQLKSTPPPSPGRLQFVLGELGGDVGAVKRSFLVFPNLVSTEPSPPSSPPPPPPRSSRPPKASVADEEDEFEYKMGGAASATDSDRDTEDGYTPDSSTHESSWTPRRPFSKPFVMKQEQHTLLLSHYHTPIYRMPNLYAHHRPYPLALPQQQSVYASPYKLGAGINEICKCGSIFGSFQCINSHF